MSIAAAAFVACVLTSPGQAVQAPAVTTSLRVFSTIAGHPEGFFLRGDHVNVAAQNFVPQLPGVVCNPVEFTLVDNTRQSFLLGSAKPSFTAADTLAQFLHGGTIEADIGTVPAAAAAGAGALISHESCTVNGNTVLAAGITVLVVISPSESQPHVIAASAADTTDTAPVQLTVGVDKAANVVVTAEYELVRDHWYPIGVVTAGQFLPLGGSYTLSWRLPAGSPPGQYRFAVRPYTPIVDAAGSPATADFFVAKPINAGLSGPTSVRIDPAGHIEVVESGNHRIRTFTLPGVAVATDSFNLVAPTDVAFLPTQNSFATLIGDASTHRVLRHERSGNTITASLFVGPQYFSAQSGPTGIAVNGGRVYVVDGDNPRIQVFTTGGAFVNSLTAPAGVLAGPAAVAVAADGSIWVADPKAGRVVHLSAAGALLSKIVPVLVKPGGVKLVTSRPVAIDVAANGDVLVADAGTATVQVLDPSGQLLWQVGRGLLKHPSGVVAVGKAGDFFVADAGQTRLLHFRVP